MTKAQIAILKDFSDGCENMRRSILWSGFEKEREQGFADAIEHLEVRFNKLYSAHCRVLNASSSADGEGS